MDSPRFIFWRESDRRHYVTLLVLTALLAALVTLLNVVVSVTSIDGQSMEPTLRQGDRILVTRGYDRPTVGDVVSFMAVERNGQPIRLIKRVVALPGDTVEVIGDSAWVNGRLSDAAPTASVGTESYRIGPMTVPDGTVYVLGDNRPVSLDSRWIGFVPLATIDGKAVAIIFPPFRIGGIDD
jgi:signal peptidase I